MNRRHFLKLAAALGVSAVAVTRNFGAVPIPKPGKAAPAERRCHVWINGMGPVITTDKPDSIKGNWNITETRQALDVTEPWGVFKKVAPGIRRWEADFDMIDTAGIQCGNIIGFRLGGHEGHGVVTRIQF